jgi:hypothetical protein
MTSRDSIPFARIVVSIAIAFGLLGLGCSSRTIETVNGPSGDVSPAPANVVPKMFVVGAKMEGDSIIVWIASPITSQYRMEIRNVSGYRVRLLQTGTMDAGVHSVTWDGTNDDGKLVKNGFYYAYAEAGPFSDGLEFQLELR